ncbi:MAG TPA: cytochrome b/b6 domain-containing protein [Arachidicoccus sp.]|nr:cytochrome b/b6 domain-containing protein [Arachidicoccus sp.]
MKPIYYTRAHRIIHWLIAGVFLFILLTVLLRQHWMNKDHIASIMQAQLKARGVQLSDADAVKIGKSVRAPMWQWHVVAGYILLGLYIIRMWIMRIQGSTFKSPFAKNLPSKERIKSSIYLLFYICFGISLVTGIILVWGSRDLHTLHKLMHDIHVKAMYYAITFVIVHLVGLVLGELGGDRGIISRMVGGK